MSNPIKQAPNIYLPPNACPPDAYDIQTSTPPADDFIISRLNDGNIVSRYGDLVWDLTPYHIDSRTYRLHFNYWGEGISTERQRSEVGMLRWLMFCIIWRRAGRPYSLSTIRSISQTLCRLAVYADAQSIRVKDVFANPKSFGEYIKTLEDKETVGFGVVLVNLLKMSPRQLGFDLVTSDGMEPYTKKAKAIKRRRRQGGRQTTPMPSHIYSQVLSSLSQELTEWERHEEEILFLVKRTAEDLTFGRKTPVRGERETSGTKPCPLGGLMSTELKQYLTRVYPLDKEYEASTLGGVICQIQYVCRLVIQAYSGMRVSEAEALPYSCLHQKTFNGQQHSFLLGRTTKLNGGRAKIARWVTNDEGVRAAKTAKRIADCIYGVIGIGDELRNGRKKGCPLFVATSHLGLKGTERSPINNKYHIGQYSRLRKNDLVARISPIIQERDIRELEEVDAHRDWASEEQYGIGNSWPLKNHQFRRSLALYAQKSGLVSLPSLRRQLQHLTNEMSLYYAKGSALAVKFVGGDTEHFAAEWLATQSESAALSYVLNVLMSDSVLFGGHANWLRHRVLGSEGVTLLKREETMQMFDRGEIFYKETLVGGCTKVGPCDQGALDWLDIDCLEAGCRNMVGSLTKLERVIKAQENFVESLAPDTVQYRTELNDLAILKAVRDKVISDDA